MTNHSTEILTLLDHAAPPFRLHVADSLYSRAVGLLGKAYLDPDEAMIITPCNFVHTLWMRFTIDVVFCDLELRILRIAPHLVPWRLSPRVAAAKSVIEFAAGVTGQHKMQVGDRFERQR